MELLNTDTLEEARRKLGEACAAIPLAEEEAGLLEAAGRICARDTEAAEDTPPFSRSVVDGFAVRAEETYGAGDSNPVFFRIAGSVGIEARAEVSAGPGEAVRVQTGSMIPEGASAVLMAEYAEEYAPGRLAGYRSLSGGENIIRAGEDIRKGSLLLRRGRRIAPSDVGMLAAQGIVSVRVFAPLPVTVISTGDELVGPEETPEAGQIRDINSFVLAAEAEHLGMKVVRMRRCRDREEEIRSAVEESLEDSGMILLSGGSSKGQKDYTKQVFEEISGNVFTHGISVKPGKPTVLAFDRESRTLLAGLPGHPAAAALMFRLLIGDWYRERTGQAKIPPYPAALSENVSSNQGRATCLLVELKEAPEGDGPGWEAVPVRAKSGSISALSRAFGYVLIPRNREGMRKGEIVRVEVLE